MSAVSVLLDRLLPQGLLDAKQAGITVGGLSLDSRCTQSGDLFLAMPGSSGHGMHYAAEAVRQGAVGVLCDETAPSADLSVPVIKAPGLADMLPHIAERFFGLRQKGLRLFGVTGTNGKTSIVQLLAQALGRLGVKAGSVGTLGAGLPGKLRPLGHTTPDIMTTYRLLSEMHDQGATHVAMEVSSHALAQGRVDGLLFDTAVFTNLTQDHLDYHHDMASYGATKARLFQWPGLASAVINVDDEFGRALHAQATCARVIGYGMAAAGAAKVGAAQVATSLRGISFELTTPWGRAEVESRLLGRFNVSNLLAVAAVLGGADFAFSDVVSALASAAPVPGRMNRIDASRPGAPLIVVDYAHTPDALAQALTSLREHAQGELICVFGCGGNRDKTKRPLMGKIAEGLADRVVITDDNPRNEEGDAIARDILSGMRNAKPVATEHDRARAINMAISQAKAGDIVLIAGKGHEAYQEIKGEKRPFDDSAQARRALEAA